MLKALRLVVIVSLTVLAGQGADVIAQVPQMQVRDLPWFMRLGQRVATVRNRMPSEDRVVLVPDEATFLDEIGKWRAGRSVLDTDPARRMLVQGCWPVLIEDDVYTPMFLRAFKPAKVIRRTEKRRPWPMRRP